MAYFVKPTFKRDVQTPLLIALGRSSSYKEVDNATGFDINNIKEVYEGINRPGKLSWLLKANFDI